MTRRWLPICVIAAITALAVAFGAWVVGRETPGSAGSSSSVEVAGVRAAPRAGEAAPSGVSVGQGEPVWLVFMATWCQECRVETPDVQEAALRGDVRVVGVFVGEDAHTVDDYQRRAGLTFETVADADATVAASYGIRAIPAHFFIDGEGVVREVAVGALSATLIEQKLDALAG